MTEQLLTGTLSLNTTNQFINWSIAIQNMQMTYASVLMFTHNTHGNESYR